MSIRSGAAGYVNSGGVAGGLLVFLVCRHMKKNPVRMAMAFKPLNNYFTSGFFKTSIVYYMHHDTFSNYFVVFFLDLKKTVHVTEMRGIISDFLS